MASEISCPEIEKAKNYLIIICQMESMQNFIRGGRSELSAFLDSEGII